MIQALGYYSPLTSPIHHLDPRVKMTALVFLSAAIFQSGAVAAVPMSIFLILLLAAARITFAQAIRYLKPVAIFFLLLFVMQALTADGEPLFSIPAIDIKITVEGLLRGSLLTWKFICLVLAGSLLTSTTLPSELVCGMERLLRPFKFVGLNSHNAATMISLAMRFVPLLTGEMERIRMAQSARGAEFDKGGIFRRAKAMSALAMPLAVNVFLRSEEVAASMEARGYGMGERSYLRELRMGKSDYFAIALAATFSLGVACFQYLA